MFKIHSYLIIIIIIMSWYQDGYPRPSLATPPNRSLLPVGSQGYTPYPHRAAVRRYELVALLLLGHVKGSIGVNHLWARPYFSNSTVWKQNSVVDYLLKDETCLQHFEPESKIQSKQWRHPESLTSKKFRQVASVVKAMEFFFRFWRCNHDRLPGKMKKILMESTMHQFYHYWRKQPNGNAKESLEQVCPSSRITGPFRLFRLQSLKQRIATSLPTRLNSIWVFPVSGK